MNLITFSFTFATLLKVILGGGTGTPDKPDLSTCETVYDVIDDNYNYIKSICYVIKELTQPQQLEYCSQIGMKLYTIESADDLAGLLKYINLFFDWGFYINAIRKSGNIWKSSLPTEPLNSVVTPINDVGGDCLTIYGTGEFRTDKCTNNWYPICQFNKNI